MSGSKVNANVARDLVSNASGKVADMNDFNKKQETRNLKAQLDNSRRREPVEEDLRSIRSEYDYGSKKKFLDVLGNVSISQKMKAALRAKEKWNDQYSSAVSERSRASFHTNSSKISRFS